MGTRNPRIRMHPIPAGLSTQPRQGRNTTRVSDPWASTTAYNSLHTHYLDKRSPDKAEKKHRQNADPFPTFSFCLKSFSQPVLLSLFLSIPRFPCFVTTTSLLTITHHITTGGRSHIEGDGECEKRTERTTRGRDKDGK